MDSCVQYFGYSKEVESPSDMFLPDEGFVCLIEQITLKLYYKAASHPSLKGFSIGDWFVSTGSCDAIEIHGFFTSMDGAFNYASEHLNVVSFRSSFESF